MANENIKAFKSGIWYTASNFFIKAIGFITTPIFTRLLTKSDFGDYNNYLSWQNIAVIIMTLNLESTLVSAKYDYKYKFDEYLFSILSLSSLSVGAWFILYLLFCIAGIHIFKMDNVYILMLFGYVLFHPAIVLFQSRESYFYRYKSNVFVSGSVAIGASLLSVIFVLTMQNRLTGRIVGSVLPTIIIGALLWMMFAIKGKHIDFTSWKYAIKICLPYIPHLLSLTLLNQVDRIMITKFCGSSDTALYSLAYNCGAIVTLLMTSMNNAYSPWLADKLYIEGKIEVREFSRKYILMFCYLALGIMLITPEILLILGGKSYGSAKSVMPPIAMGCVCQFLYTMHVNIEQYKKKIIGMAIASVIAALLNYVLNYIFIPIYGYEAAAYTTLAGYLCLLLIHMFLIKQINMSDYYDNRFIIAIILFMMAITIVVNFIYMNQIIRYLIIVGYMLFVVITAKRVWLAISSFFGKNKH